MTKQLNYTVGVHVGVYVRSPHNAAEMNKSAAVYGGELR